MTAGVEIGLLKTSHSPARGGYVSTGLVRAIQLTPTHWYLSSNRNLTSKCMLVAHELSVGDLRCRSDCRRRLVRLADITEALEFDENPVGGKIR